MAIRLETKITWGLDVSWVFSIKDPHDIETYASGLKVLGHKNASGGEIITVAINAA
jgi:hypothetical protein